MVAPALAALGMFLLGTGSSAVSTAAMQRLKQSESEKQRALFQESIARAQGKFPGMPAGMEGGFDPLADNQSTQRFGLNLMNDPLTAEMGGGILERAMSDATQRQGQSMTQQTAMRGQDMDAQQALATLQQQQVTAQRAAGVEREGRLQTVRNDIQPIVAPLVTASGLAKSALNAPEGFAGDGVIVRAFARQLNPVGPLSDDDVAAVANDPSIPSMIANAIGKWRDGDKLTSNERGLLKQAMAGLYRNNRDSALTMAGPVLTTADRLGFPRNEVFDESVLLGDDVLQQYEGFQPTQPGTAPPARKIERTPELEAEYQAYLKQWRKDNPNG